MWSLVDLQCSHAELPIRETVAASIDRENDTLFQQWTPVLCVTGNSTGSHVTLLTRLQQDIGAALGVA